MRICLKLIAVSGMADRLFVPDNIGRCRRTWSVPTIVNMRKDHEQSLLVGPGRGMVTSKGRILFTAYEFTGSDKNSVAIYSDDGGKTWERGKSVSG